MTRRPLVLVLIAAALAGGAVFAGERDGGGAPMQEPRPSAPTIAGLAADAVAPHLRALARVARRSGGNRAAGTRGYDRSAEYVVQTLRSAGWQVRTQTVTFPFFRQRRAPRVRFGGQRLRRGTHVRTMTYSGSGTVRGRVRAFDVVPGRASAAGCSRAALRALRPGEIAVVQRGTCTLREKALNAQAEGAVAVLIPNDGRPGRTGTIAGTLGSPGVRVPVLSLSTWAGVQVARARRAAVSVSTVSTRRRTTNVIAEAGAGERVVMAGAHLDSVRDGPGMNDNASGVSALLAAAPVLAARVPEQARIRLGFWGAEELGLHGSRRYVNGLSARERRAIRAYVNLDMVGSPGRAPGVYADGAAVKRALRRALQRQGRTRIPSRSAGAASDHAPFAARGIPVGGIFTGVDRCYHRRCDDLDNVDRRLIADVAAASASVLLGLARS